MRELQDRRGYQEISTPILVHKKLWEQSGHWDLYDDNMFRVEVRGPDVQPQADELPRVARSSTARSCARTATCRSASASTAGCTGTSARARCSGLTRVRQFIQDDAHIYVRPDQLAAEIEALLGEVREAYSLVRARAALRVRDEARQGASATRRSGSEPRA